MDYEQKYKEIIENIKEAKERMGGYIFSSVVDKIIPELSLSSDERIRKEMIEILRKETQEFPSSVIAEKSNSWIAWLEKQDPKKHEEELEKAYKTADKVQYKKGYEDAKREFEKQGEQKSVDNLRWNELTWEDVNTLEEIINEVHSDFRNGIGAESFGEEVLERFREIKGDEYTDTCEQNPAEDEDREYACQPSEHYTRRELMIYNLGIADGKRMIEDAIKETKQNPTAWSEEDKSMLNDIIHNIHFAETNRNVTGSSSMEKEQVNWLKSLKDRIQSQPKQEWSKEDERILKEIVPFFKDGTVILQNDLDLYAGFLEKRLKYISPQKQI